MQEVRGNVLPVIIEWDFFKIGKMVKADGIRL